METMGTIGWLAVAALVLAGLAFLTMGYLVHLIRTWRREDREWRANFDGRFTALESRILGSTLPESPPLRPAFTGRDSAEPSYGSPPAPGDERERQTLAPPRRR